MANKNEVAILDFIAGQFGRRVGIVARLFYTLKSIDKVVVILELAEKLQVTDEEIESKNAKWVNYGRADES